MVANPKSWKDIRDRRRKENFVGRRNEMHLFEENFSESPRFMVFAITGEGGVGKSTLLDRFNVIAIASKIGAIVIKCDDKQGTPVVAMGHVASELGKLGISHKDFDERYKKYCELRQEIESDPKVPRSAVNVISMGITDFTIKSLRKAPGVGVFFEYADEKAAGEALTELIQYGISKWGNKDEVQLLREPERILTPLFIELINRACEKKRIVIMFDVFERTSDVLSPWLLALFDFKYGVFNTRLTFVISGRDSLEQHWTELAGMVCYIRLEPFMLDETRVYLSNQGISDEKLVNQIYQDTGGLPVLVELLAATKPTPGCDLPDISKDAVERFLQWTPEEDKRTVALLAAVPRQFNLDILGAILGEDATKLFNWLAIQSYIRRTTERGWFYHEKVRELMLRYIHSTTPAKLLDKHIKLFQYFSSSQEKLELSEKDQYQSDLWCNYEIEKTYHLLMAYPDQMETNALNTFFLAFRYNWKFAGKVANICQQAASENDVVPFTELANLLMEIYVLYERGDYRVLVEKFALIDNERMSPKALSGFLSRRGYANYWVEEYDKALVNYNYAIELDDKYAWAIASRGQTYRQMEKYKESLADFNRAIELDDKVAWVIASRGETYRLMEKYEEALADYTRAIELDDKYAWAVASRGLTYQLMKKYEESLTDFNHAIELDDKAAWVIASRGQTYRLMEKYEEALADYTRAIELDDKYAWAIASRGLTYQLMKKYEESLTDSNRAIELDDKAAWVFASRGQTYRQMEKYKESLADFNRAIELDDKVAWVIASRGETYRLMEKYEEALADYTRAIELDDKYAWAVASRGLTYQLMKKYEESLTDFNHAIELDDKAAWVIASRGQTYRLMEKYEEALADYTRAIEVDDKYAWAVASRGLTYQRLKRYKEAITDLKNAVELEPDNANNICNYAGLLLGQGFLDEGFIMLDRAIKSLPIPNSPGVAAELWFYSFIHWPQKRKTALKNLKKVLCSGDRSLGWDFSENIARARQDERSDIDWIEKLALVISTNRDVSELDNWSDWKNV